MYRAVEITEERGKRYFAVTSASSSSSAYAIQTPSMSTTTATVYSGGPGPAIINASTTTTIPGPTTSGSGGWCYLEFRVLADARSGAVDSQQVRQDLGLFIGSRR